MVVKGCGKGCELRLFLAKKELGVNLFRCGYRVRGWWLWRGIAGRGEVGGWLACGKMWGLKWACGRKRVFKFRQHNRFFLYCTQCKSKVLHFRRYNLPLLHTIIMVAKSLVRAFF